MIHIHNATKSYGKKKVVDHVNLTLEKGTLTAFIGSNGAGKSTLLSMICRLISMDEGDITIDNKNITDWNSNELAKKISILKQSNHMNLKLTIQELVAFGRYPYSKGVLKEEDSKKIDEAIEYVGLSDIRHRYIDELSGGQRQMAFIAMIIAQDTEFIFLDEPLNNLDMKHSVEIMKTLRRLVDQLGKTVIVVIHEINFVSCYADRILALKNGKLVAYGSNKDIMTPDMLQTIYDMPMHIQTINNKDICIYYT